MRCELLFTEDAIHADRDKKGSASTNRWWECEPVLLYTSLKMAPSATETTTTEHLTAKLTSNTGPYKELAPIGYEKDVEEQGKDGLPAAKVSVSQHGYSAVRG